MFGPCWADSTRFSLNEIRNVGCLKKVKISPILRTAFNYELACCSHIVIDRCLGKSTFLLQVLSEFPHRAGIAGRSDWRLGLDQLKESAESNDVVNARSQFLVTILQVLVHKRPIKLLQGKPMLFHPVSEIRQKSQPEKPGEDSKPFILELLLVSFQMRC